MSVAEQSLSMQRAGFRPVVIEDMTQLKEPQDAALFSSRTVEGRVYPLRRPIPTNVFGIVIPPAVEACLGDACKYRGEADECEYTRHHLHSSAPLYEDYGDLAIDFREQLALTVWLRRCQHDVHHAHHEIDVAVPSLEVMQQAIKETRILRRLAMNHNSVEAIDKRLLTPDVVIQERKGLKRRKESLLAEHPRLVEKVHSIELLPQQLIVGALLVAAPNHGRSQLMMGNSYVLTGTMRKDQIDTALQLVDEVAIQAA